MNDTGVTPVDAAPVYPLALAPALLPIDAEAAGLPDFPSDHPAWQRDVVSISSRSRGILASIAPVVVRTLSFWDHRLRELTLGVRTLTVDPAGCYRLR